MDRARRRDAALLAAVLIAAALLRAACLRTEPWFDEVWSIGFARGARSALGVFLDIRHDNSHPLNTLWLYLVSGSRDWAVLRLFSFACGLMTVAALAVDPEDRPRGLLAAALAAASVPLVLFSTEARGYAPMALCAVLGRLLLSGPRTPRRDAAFALCAALGLFSQFLFVCVLAALLVRLAAETPRGRLPRALLRPFGPPIVLFGLYALRQIGLMQFGRGNPRSFASASLGALAQLAGAPPSGPLALLGAAALSVLCAAELVQLRRERPIEFRFHAVLLSAASVLVACVPFRSERYFFVCAPFALLLAASSLLRLMRGGRAARTAGAALLGLYLLGSALRVRALATAGRGHYLEAVRRMAADTPGNVVTVASDHDFRNRKMLDFYAADLPPAKRLEYVPSGLRAARPPDWFILHSLSTDPRAAPERLSLPGASYRLVEVYPYAGLSGWTWMLYRREAR